MEFENLPRNTKHPRDYKLLFHPSFDATIAEIRLKKIRLPSMALPVDLDFSSYDRSQNGEVLSIIGELGKTKLDPARGQEQSNQMLICAYDESVNKFLGLEGTGYLTSHSLILHGEEDFIPMNLLTFYFYTRSMTLSHNSTNIRHSEDPDADSKRDYVKDRKEFLTCNIPEESIVFVDGPLIGQQMSKYTLELNDSLMERNIVPFFSVKNSTSNLVTNYVQALKGRYNSDMHWAYSYLKEGERTNFFRYEDQSDKQRALSGKAFTKVFCYLKAFNASPSRIEIDVKTFEKYQRSIPEWLDLAYYLLLAQGDPKDPQIRSVAIAEKYARATINLINFIQMMKELGITPTMNQERFAW